MTRKKKVWKTKQCPRCQVEFHTSDGDKYCGDCAKTVKAELDLSGYLQKKPLPPWCRGYDKQQDMGREPSPWNENAVRALEGD